MIQKTNIKLSIALFLLIELCSSSIKQIELSQTKHIVLEIDQNFQQNIPKFFDMYQSSMIVNMTHQNINIGKQICLITQKSKSQYIPFHSAYHYFGISDPERYYLGDKKVYKFSQLKKLTGVLDVIQFDGQIVVMFYTGYYNFYNVNKSDGTINLAVIRTINANQNATSTDSSHHMNNLVVNYGLFVHNSEDKNHLIFFSEDRVFVLDKQNKTFQQLNGYIPVGYQFQKAIIQQNLIYVAASDKGVLIYQLDLVNKLISLKQQFKVQIQDSDNQILTLSISDLAYDIYNKKMIVIDQEEGIFWVSVPVDKQMKYVLCQQKSIPTQRCQNLNIVPSTSLIIATCPLLVVINLKDLSHQVIQQIQFYPRDVIVNDQRIMIFGQYRYAIYDIESKLVEVGESNHQIEFVVALNQWIVIVNRFDISTGRIKPGIQQITCAVNTQTHKALVGINKAKLVIEGMCSQLFDPSTELFFPEPSLFLPNREDHQKIKSYSDLKQNCQLIYPVQIQVVDSSILSYVIEFIIVGIILWITCVGGMYYLVKDIKVRKQYETLEEQPTFNNQKQNKQSVISAKDQITEE